MEPRFGKSGNGATKGLVDLIPIGDGCSLFKANPQQPPPQEEMPIAIADVLQKWMFSTPVKIRETLPVIKDGNMIGLFVWWDKPG
jgi:hypothetical protein